MWRRQFILTTLAAATRGRAADSEWGGPVLDIHLHPRRDQGVELEHLEGSGVRRAVLLPGAGSEERAAALVAKSPDRFARFTNADVRSPECGARLTAALKTGANGIGELKYPVQADGPEMRRVYGIAAEFRVPVLLHFEEGNFNSGFTRLSALLKAHPNTVFIGHGQSWWANISAEVGNETGYPAGRIVPGGLTDKLLADYPNIYGDLSANSGRNALARDPDFAAPFLARHRGKLIFGCDCPCRDGHGAGQPSQAPALKGKCIARETLTLLKGLAPAELFRRITWENGKALLSLND